MEAGVALNPHELIVGQQARGLPSLLVRMHQLCSLA